MAPRNRKQQLLERLEQESWQLELLISGFTIFLLIAAKEPLDVWTRSVGVTIQLSFPGSPLNILPVVVYGSWFFVTVNLLLHVLLRGMWISAIGLRSVSGGIDLPSFRMSRRYRRFLRPQLRNYDVFIERLERLSSVMFAYTFLIVFALISITLVVLTFFVFIRLLQGLDRGLALSDTAYRTLNILVFAPLVLSLLVYFVDFVTLGRVKRLHWFSHGYYPFYRFWGWITLAFLYRPLYYNLVDHRQGRRLARLLVPYIIFINIVALFTCPVMCVYPAKIVTGVCWGASTTTNAQPPRPPASLVPPVCLYAMVIFPFACV